MPPSRPAQSAAEAARPQLASAVRRLRERLTQDLASAAEGAYRLSLPASQARLSPEAASRRQQLEAHLGQGDASRSLSALIEQRASTLVNRLVLLRHLEARGARALPVLTGGITSKACRELASWAPPLAEGDDRGLGLLLSIAFDELSLDLPGLFAEEGAERLLPLPASTLLWAVGALDAPELSSAWADDTTLGWVYQYWADPDRERAERGRGGEGKVLPHAIASQTQMFTERYLVEWLLENSLLPVWLSMCRRRGVDPGDLSRFRYLVPRPPPERSPERLCELRLLDPACGSGHFLVIAFDLLAELHEREARLSGRAPDREAIARTIVEENLFGVDVDARAVQIAAAAMLVKARAYAPGYAPRRMNLASPGALPEGLGPDHPAMAELERDLAPLGPRGRGVAERLSRAIADLPRAGTLFRVEAAADQALGQAASEADREQVIEAAARLLGRVSQACAPDDLGLGLGLEPAASRFLRIVREASFDVVVGNPPYLGTQRLADAGYLDQAYPDSKEDLYAAFLERSLELARPGGLSALVTMRGWLFVSHFERLRRKLLIDHRVELLADLGPGAFETVPGVEASATVLERGGALRSGLALEASSGKDRARKAESLAARERLYSFDASLLAQVPGCPLLYRWSPEQLGRYLEAPKLGEVAEARVGMKTSDNARFVRFVWEVRHGEAEAIPAATTPPRRPQSAWVPYIKGAAGKAWIEPLEALVWWRDDGLEVRLALDHAYGQPPQAERRYFTPGVAFTTIARSFLARKHRYLSIFDVAGSSVFGLDPDQAVCLLNASRSRAVVEELNPTVNFQVGDVARIPVEKVEHAASIMATLERAFAAHEAGREASFEFVRPSPSPWRSAQAWASRAVDLPPGEPLPPFEPSLDPAPPEAHLSFALGVALGRFSPEGGTRRCFPEEALPGGIAFVSAATGRDSLSHPACSGLLEAWAQRGAGLGEAGAPGLRAYLRSAFFAWHRDAYAGRPIFWPLASSRRTFVAWVSIHALGPRTLPSLLALHIAPEKRALEARMAELREAEGRGDRGAGRRRGELAQRLDELSAFASLLDACASLGPPAPDEATPPRERDAPFDPAIDDGVRVNASLLWPLLEPLWKDPKKWWKQLAEGPGGHDASAAAARYFPARVRASCQREPSIAAAHRSLWAHHPEVAHRAELRLGRPLGEPDADAARKRFLEESPSVSPPPTGRARARAGRGGQRPEAKGGR